MLKNTLIFSFFAIVSQLYGTIVEVAHFSEIRSHVDKNTLVLLDIDDTLLIPTQMLGCDEWFQYRYNEHKALGVSLALEKTLAEWEAIRHLTKMEIVEMGTDEIVRELQQEFSVMGLTTQGLALATRTSQQLKENSLDLSLSAPSGEDHCVSIGGHAVLYRKGILFTSGQAKGESLFKLCEKIGIEPARIVFINDKKEHLQDIETAAQRRGVEFIGLRYGFSDERKKAFDPKIATYQFTHSSFDHLLTDEEARICLE